MTEPDSAPTVRAVSESLRAALEAAPGAAFVIDPRSAHLLAASAAGHRYFPALGPKYGLALDGAMPAVRRLRQAMRDGQSVTGPLPLLFWTSRGARCLTCTVEAVSGLGGIPLVLLQEVPASGDAPSPRRPDEEVEASLTVNPPRSDKETLQEIARRIREGQQQHLAPASSPESKPLSGPDAGPEPPPEAQLEPGPQPDAEAVREGPRPAEDHTQRLPVRQPSDTVPQPIDVAKLAHELKTPLSAIAAAAEIMKDARFGPIANERYAGYVGDIHASARHALTLIERMLHPQNNELATSAAVLKFERLDLDALVTSCMSSVSPLAAAKGVDLSAVSSRQRLDVTADATSLRQIILNLLTNAIKFTPARGTIRVTTGRGPGGANFVTVADDGPGMSPVAIADAMRPVPPAERSARDGGGLGIGLPLSRALAEENGAGFDIDSTPGGGTRITLTFRQGRLIPI